MSDQQLSLGARRRAWRATRVEEVLWPAQRICNPHHHLWGHAHDEYFAAELAADIGDGHNVQKTVYVECEWGYRDSGLQEMKSEALHLNPPISRVALREVLIECVQRAGLADAYVEMIVTRGSPPPGDRDPRNFKNRFYAFAVPYVGLLKPDDQLRGSHLVIARDVMRIDQNAVDPTVKNFHWGDLTRGLFEAFAREADTLVLLNAAGEVTEGPGFNLFVVSAGRLCTPRSGVLLGITRDTVMQLAARAGIATSVTMFGAEHLRKAEEIFLTSTAGGVMPVTRLDGQPVGDGQPGAITLALRQAYWDAHHEPQWTTPVRH